ncbi:hypothetical protein BKA62DRAFT_425953 [Auriculariales sp. MPI-PUGE-AT-0066]|nr:hypothetical protein BKA62DRAFT_425953 [Auriculariales sp. MPI-PUGE-AT-0066]
MWSLLPALCLVLGSTLAVASVLPPVFVPRQSDIPDPTPNAQTGPQVQFVGPDHSNPVKEFPTCTTVTFNWFYNDQNIADSFNMYITNVGVSQAPYVPPSSSSSTSLSSRTGTLTSLPTIPTDPPSAPVRFGRRADVTMPVILNQKAVVSPHSMSWQIQVPAGFYRLTGESTTQGSTTWISQSDRFNITAGDTSCFGQVTTSSGAETELPTGSAPLGSSNKTGVIAGAVVGSIIGLIAMVALFFACVFFRRKNARPTPRPPPAAAWGQVNSQDSRHAGADGVRGLPVGSINRLSRNAEAMVDDQESLEEKYAGGSASSHGHSTGFSPEPPVFRRQSQTSQAFALGVLSTRDSRRSTIQSLPSTVTPTNATPMSSPIPPSESEGALSIDTAATSVPTVGRSNSVAKKPLRKPVPAYRTSEVEQAASKHSNEEGRTQADLGAQMISNSQRSDSVLLNAFPFELDGAQGQVHYLIPDPPVAPRR